jgi:hypothetical protein
VLLGISGAQPKDNRRDIVFRARRCFFGDLVFRGRKMRNTWLIAASLAWIIVMGGALLVMVMLY